MSSHDRTPVLVGIAQVEQREDEILKAQEPVDLMLAAIRKAAEDSGNPEILVKTGSIRVIRGVWPYADPARYLAQQLGLNGVETGLTTFGGNGVQATLNLSCDQLLDGMFDAIVLVGAECGRTQARARRQGHKLHWRKLSGTPTSTLTPSLSGRHEVEAQRGIGGPTLVYPMIENAIRFNRQESIDAHVTRVSELWSRFSEVASNNPNAWLQRHHSAEEIRTTSTTNRAVSFPYPKLMNANNNVDQGAALILTTLGVAKRLSIPPDKYVYPIAGTEAHDTVHVSHRAHLHRAPGLRTAAARCLELAEVEVDELDHVDLYSCFPSAVQVAAQEIGLSEQRPLTVTGGLTFGGGPLNNYVMHAIARTAELLRESPSQIGLVTANGGHLTKHSHGVYSCTPKEFVFRHANVQDDVDTTNDRCCAPNPSGPLRIETYTVMYVNGYPSRAFAALLSEDGIRTWGSSTDQEVMKDMATAEFCGRGATVDEKGMLSIV